MLDKAILLPCLFLCNIMTITDKACPIAKIRAVEIDQGLKQPEKLTGSGFIIHIHN